MDYIAFRRESNNFTDILTDVTIRKAAKTKMEFSNHLIIGLENNDKGDSTKIMSYAILKYGDDVVEINKLIPDRSPVMNVDYVPKRK